MKYLTFQNKGNVTIPVALAGSAIVAAITGASAYFGTVNAQNEKVASVKEELKADISQDRQDISALKTSVNTIISNQYEQSRDIKEILKNVK